MECPNCGHNRAYTKNTRNVNHYIRRTRVCHNCNERYTTHELIITHSTLPKFRKPELDALEVGLMIGKRTGPDRAQLDALIEGWKLAGSANNVQDARRQLAPLASQLESAMTALGTAECAECDTSETVVHGFSFNEAQRLLDAVREPA